MIDVLSLCVLVTAVADPVGEAAGGLPSAGEILDRYVLVLGGSEVLEKDAPLRVEGTIELTSASIEGTFVGHHAPPDRYRLAMELEGLGILEQGCRNGVGWDLDDMQGAVLLEGPALELRKLRADAFAPLRYRENYASIEVLERTTFEERPCYAVRCSTSWGYEELQYFDVGTGFLLGSVFDEPVPGGGTLRMTSVFDDYRRFGDRWYPALTTTRTVAGDQVMRVEKVEGVPLDEAVFEPPAEIRALMEK